MESQNVKIGISYKLFWAIMLAASLAVVSLVWITHWNLERGFLHLIKETEQAGIVRLTDSLQKHYSTEKSWSLLQQDGKMWRELIFFSLPHVNPQQQSSPPPPPPQAGRLEEPEALPFPPHLMQNLTGRIFLLDNNRKLLIGSTIRLGKKTLIPLKDQDQTIGYLGYFPLKRLTDNRQLHFLEKQKFVFFLVAGIIVLLSSFLSFLLTRKLVRPLKDLAGATHTLTRGDFSCRVPVTTTDELGHLAADFNLLALTLEKNEQARKQWVVDISHELRTPIGILRGEIEALQDGIRQTNAESLQSLRAETIRLGRLVDDLYQLSMSDPGALSYRKTKIDLIPLIAAVVTSFRHEFDLHGIQLSLAEEQHFYFYGDAERLRQLFSNLLENTLKYTDSGGTLKVSMSHSQQTLTINFMDSSPAVPEEDLEHLFERLYRVDSSRSRSTGGAGLGLAICRNIVEAHQGTISAQSSPSGGLWIQVQFPESGVIDG